MLLEQRWFDAVVAFVHDETKGRVVVMGYHSVAVALEIVFPNRPQRECLKEHFSGRRYLVENRYLRSTGSLVVSLYTVLYMEQIYREPVLIYLGRQSTTCAL